MHDNKRDWDIFKMKLNTKLVHLIKVDKINAFNLLRARRN